MLENEIQGVIPADNGWKEYTCISYKNKPGSIYYVLVASAAFLYYQVDIIQWNDGTKSWIWLPMRPSQGRIQVESTTYGRRQI